MKPERKPDTKRPQPKKQARVKWKVKVPKNRPTPFDLKSMLRALHEQEFLSGEALRQKLASILVKHRLKFPADFNVHDMVKTMRESGWLISGCNPEMLMVKIPGVKPWGRVGRKKVGFQNPGGDQSKVEPVYALTKEERRRKGEVKTLWHIIEAGERAEAKIEALQTKCNHRVFEDTAGVPYGIRNCVICGSGCGVV